MKPVLIGWAPGPRTRSRGVWDKDQGTRLASLAGLDHTDRLAERFDLVNLFDRHLIADGSGLPPLPKVAIGYLALETARATKDRTVIISGMKTAVAFGIAPEPRNVWRYAEWAYGNDGLQWVACSVVANTCGLNTTLWNDPTEVAEASKFLRSAHDIDEKLAIEYAKSVRTAKLAKQESLEPMVGFRDLVKITGMSFNHLRNLVATGAIPHYRMTRHSVRFRLSEIRAWIELSAVGIRKPKPPGNRLPLPDDDGSGAAEG